RALRRVKVTGGRFVQKLLRIGIPSQHAERNLVALAGLQPIEAGVPGNGAQPGTELLRPIERRQRPVAPQQGRRGQGRGGVGRAGQRVAQPKGPRGPTPHEFGVGLRPPRERLADQLRVGHQSPPGPASEASEKATLETTEREKLIAKKTLARRASEECGFIPSAGAEWEKSIAKKTLARRASERCGLIPSLARRATSLPHLDTHSVHPLRYSRRMNASASLQLVACSLSPSQSSFLPARMATLPSRMNSVSTPA